MAAGVRVSLNRLAVRNFQSLRQVDIDLGAFTVIVGPSSSGKSALIRAFRALASNVRGSDVITRGQKAMSITARTDSGVVSLERSDRSSAYRLTGDDGQGQAFTKLGGEVPAAVTEALRLDPAAGSINFANQFDKPFLLDESGAAVARELGELTQVTRIFEAVRQANRVRTAAAAQLRTRRADLETVKTKLASFAGLGDRLMELTGLERRNDERHQLEARIGRLRSRKDRLRQFEQALASYCPLEVPEGAGALLYQLRAAQDLQMYLHRLKDEQQRVAAATEQAAIQEREMAELTREVTASGKCPTCGQVTRTGASV